MSIPNLWSEKDFKEAKEYYSKKAKRRSIIKDFKEIVFGIIIPFSISIYALLYLIEFYMGLL